jgi:hypothetical protein
MQPFIFISDLSTLHDENALVLDVDPGLDAKESLFSWFAEHLNFPAYFGSNWDAFDEILRDLSWVKQRKVVLLHRDLPMSGKGTDQRIYLETLANAVRDWQSDPSHELVVAFDSSCELKLRGIMRIKQATKGVGDK